MWTLSTVAEFVDAVHFASSSKSPLSVKGAPHRWTDRYTVT
jgi:hypothetical protein